MSGKEDFTGEIVFGYSPSDEFLYCYGYNKGYKTLSNKVANCLFLSSRAKELYNVLRTFYWGKDEKDITVYPSRDLLCDMLGIENNTLTEYLTELYDSGLVCSTREFGGKTKYHFQELHDAHVLYHSETIYLHIHPKLKGKEFRDKLKKYVDSDLYKSIQTCEEVAEKTGEIVEWFFGAGEEVKSESIIKRTVKIAPTPTGSQSGDQSTKPTGRVRAESYKQKSTDRWNLQDFKDYFKNMYEETFKLPLPPIGEKTVNSLTTIIRILKDNNLVKEYMDIFIENDKNFQDASLAVFCWNSTQASLAHYKRTGEFIAVKDFKKTEAKKIEAVEDDDLVLLLEKLKSGGGKSG